MEAKTIYQLEEDDLKKAFGDVLRNVITDEFFYAKYHDIYIESSTVMDIWKVGKDTITNWIKARKIRPINPGGNPYKFRLSEILRENPKHRHINSIV